MRSQFFFVLLALLLSGIPATASPDAVFLVQNGRANEALAALNSQIQSSPNDARAYNLLCRVYFQLELWDEAIRPALKAVALAPQESGYHQWLARAYGRKAEHSSPFVAFTLVRKVKAEFEKAVELDPNGKNLSARADLAEFYIEAPYFMGGDKAKARRLADFVMNLDPALAHSIRAEVDEKQNVKGSAEEEYKAALQASGNSAHYWVMLASFYRRSARFEDMERAITQSLRSPSNDGISLFDAAAVLFAAGRNFPGAVQMLRQYLSQEDPAEDGPAFQAHYFLGVLLEKQGDAKAAADEYRATLSLASDYRLAQTALTRVDALR